MEILDALINLENLHNYIIIALEIAFANFMLNILN